MSAGRNTTLRDRYRRSISRTKPDCHHCNEPIDYTAGHLDPKSFTIDHLIPLAKGGPDTLDNLVPSCRACNAEKSDKVERTGPLYVTARNW